ncbi:NosD domain-containing protein [Chondromyces apiculatus]|nr:right-handed parallel beta-helix repeat-containing protein [Chondromyces apiculatus]
MNRKLTPSISRVLGRAVAVTLGLSAVAVGWHQIGWVTPEGVAHAQYPSGSGGSGGSGGDMPSGFDPEAMAEGPDAPLSCAPIPPGGFAGVTNDRFYFLSEVGGCENLPCFLASVPGTVHANATLVIDELCVLDGPIRIPSRFTLAGVGPGGEGMLVFQDLPDNMPAISVEEAVGVGGISEIVIRDLGIFGDDNGAWSAGINVSGANLITLDRVRVSGFSVGLFGQDAYSVRVSDSTFYANAFNVMIYNNANHWRVRDSALSLATFYSVKVFGPSDGVRPGNNDHLFSGNRFEGSLMGAMMLGSVGTMLMNNRFESNGLNGVRILPSASDTRVVGNLFSTDTVHDSSASTKCGFNIGLPTGDCPGD